MADVDPTPGGPGPAELIAALVRERRTVLGLSMRELARRAGTSQPFISKLEHAQLLPSVQTLYSLASALGTTPANLLPVLGEHPVDAAGAHLAIPATEASDVRSVEVLTSHQGAATQLYSIELAADDPGTPYQHAGEEVGYVLSGTVRIDHVGGTELLRHGEALAIDPTTEHRWSSVGGVPARLLLICVDTRA